MATWPFFAPYSFPRSFLSKSRGALVVVFNVKGLFSRSWVRFLPIVLGDIGNRKITSTVFCIPELLKNTCDLNGQVLSFLISLNTGSRKEQQEKSEGLYLWIRLRKKLKVFDGRLPGIWHVLSQTRVTGLIKGFFFRKTGPTVLKTRLSRCTFHSAKISVSDEWNVKETLASTEHFCWFYPSWNYLADVLAFSLIAQLLLREIYSLVLKGNKLYSGFHSIFAVLLLLCCLPCLVPRPMRFW